MKNFGSILLQIILLELIVGGGGRFTAFGPVSLRMVLFAVAMLYTAYQILKGRKINVQYFGLVLLFILVMAAGISMGSLNGASHGLLFEDVKPLSFFFILPFFALTITGMGMLNRIARLMIYGAFGMAVLYILILLLMHTGIVPFGVLYNVTTPTEELFYRGELAFFYKGFIYLCIGLIFIYFLKPNYSVLLVIVIVLAIILAFTRGLIFALLLTAFVYYLIEHTALKYKLLKLCITLICAAAVVLYGNAFYSQLSMTIYSSNLHGGFSQRVNPEHLLGNRDFSDNERKKQLNQVMERTTLTSSLIGHGFGIGVPVRPVHMEISYLEIFHKQGILGLLFWAFLFYMLTIRYFRAVHRQDELANAFYFGALFIFFQSLTNQYFNNPIGMSFILVALVSLNVLAKES